MKIFLDTIGCRLNQAEIEILARQFRTAGHEIVPDAGEADLAIVNTCTVTGQAASDSRAAIRRANRQGARGTVVTGCWVTLEPSAAGALPGVRRVVPNPDKETLVADLLDLPEHFFDLEPLARRPLPGQHARTRAFIKVQDGCNNECTYCITALARGNSRSRRSAEILRDVQAALDGGTREVVLTGVHLGAWGQDFSSPLKLGDLIADLLAKTAIPRLRLSSLEPWDLEADFFSLWRDPSLCPHLHLPLQSGSPAVLKRMRRKTTPESYMDLVTRARAAIPDVAITTDIITGFPGETQAEFKQTLDFIRQAGFAGGHIFTYSARPGTPAARMKGQVRAELRRERSGLLREALDRSAQDYAERFIGRVMPVLWEAGQQRTASGWRVQGLTSNYLRVSSLAAKPSWNEIDLVRLDSWNGDGLQGNICKRDEG